MFFIISFVVLSCFLGGLLWTDALRNLYVHPSMYVHSPPPFIIQVIPAHLGILRNYFLNFTCSWAYTCISLGKSIFLYKATMVEL